MAAHNRTHWAHGGGTIFENLVLLCYQHHRLVHEGGYTVEGDPEAGFRFRNRHGIVWPHAPPRTPPARADDLLAHNHAHGLRIDPKTNRNGTYGDFDLRLVVAAITSAVGWRVRARVRRVPVPARRPRAGGVEPTGTGRRVD